MSVTTSESPVVNAAPASREELVSRLHRLRRRLREEKYAPLLRRLQSIKEVQSEEERAAVEAMRDELRDRGLLPPEHNDAFHLLRYLKASRFQLPRAIEMWAAYIMWWEEYGGYDLLSFDYTEQAAANQAIRGSHHGVCRKGRPVYYETVGRNDMIMFHQVTTLDRYVRYKAMDGLVSYAARFPACSVAAGRQITEVVFVLDVKEMGWKNATPQAVTLLRDLGKLEREIFVEITPQIVLINASSFLRIIWSALQAILGDMMNRVQLMGQDYMDELSAIVDPSQIPFELGGTCRCTCPGGCLNADRGPWRDPQVMEVVHLMRRGALGVKNPVDYRQLAVLGPIRWQDGEFKLYGESVPEEGTADVIGDVSSTKRELAEEAEPASTPKKKESESRRAKSNLPILQQPAAIQRNKQWTWPFAVWLYLTSLFLSLLRTLVTAPSFILSSSTSLQGPEEKRESHEQRVPSDDVQSGQAVEEPSELKLMPPPHTCEVFEPINAEDNESVSPHNNAAVPVIVPSEGRVERKSLTRSLSKLFLKLKRTSSEKGMMEADKAEFVCKKVQKRKSWVSIKAL